MTNAQRNRRRWATPVAERKCVVKALRIAAGPVIDPHPGADIDPLEADAVAEEWHWAREYLNQGDPTIAQALILRSAVL